jgi:hypothetical protein
MPMPGHVFVAVPAVDAMVTAPLAAFLCTLPARTRGAWQCSLHLVPGLRPVHYARNACVGAFLATDADALWFIDHDMVPDDDSARLLDCDADIVAGRCLALRPSRSGDLALTVPAYGQWVAGAGFAPVQPDRAGEIIAAGAANLLIRRGVLADPRMRLDPSYRNADDQPRSLADDPGEPPAIFRTLEAPNGRTLLGEDVDFVHRAHLLGYRCAFEPASRMGHLKTVDLDAVELLLKRALAQHLAAQPIPAR